MISATLPTGRSSARRAAGTAMLLAGLLIAWLAGGAARAAADWFDQLPYGLAWGMSLEQVLETGIRLEYGALQGPFGHEYLAFDRPEWLGDENQVFFYFGYDDRLWRIAVHSVGYSDEGFGTALSVRYEELKAALDTYYGPGEEFSHLHHTAQSVPRRLMGTIQLGASWLFSEYRSETEHVQLGLRARNVWTGFYALYLKNLKMEAKVSADAEIYAAAIEAEQEPPFPAPHLVFEQ